MADTFQERLKGLLAGILPDDTVAPGFFKNLLKNFSFSTTEAELARRNAILQGGRLGPSTDVFTDLQRLRPGPGSALAPDLLTQPKLPPRQQFDIGLVEASSQENIKRLQESTLRSNERVRKAQQGTNRALLRQGTLPEDLLPVDEPFQPPVLFPGKANVDAFLARDEEDEEDDDEL